MIIDDIFCLVTRMSNHLTLSNDDDDDDDTFWKALLAVKLNSKH